ncbi:putative ATPase 2 [Neospora caninum Liverpool]|uniref:Phospholipid-transporting ATPase n=1 Tax=Neospora caninum (strain Liverpool) TaxID=572307 RepID=F0VPB5_NEOCL|nr:putative ATPase 2 [Neospora caninum Liverpool]CBZ55561.1 putative ATPase 2 [Neospora caninum Liverpool]|eukprot:XP_003885589.1 putative ATPase 2 [Neospora caninum Liverpool]
MKAANLCSCLRRRNRRPEEREWRVTLNGPQVLPACGNRVVTSKYTVWNFPFKNFWEQLHRISNIYFFFIGFLQCIPQISGTGGLPTISLPLSVVLICNAVKDAVEDYRRHQADDHENGQLCLLATRAPAPSSSSALVSLLTRVFHFLCPRRRGRTAPSSSSPPSPSGSLSSSAPIAAHPWASVEIGDIVVCFRNAFFPADLLLLASSDSHGVAFVETAGLDGEGNLKVKQMQKDLALWVGHRPRARASRTAPSPPACPRASTAPHAALYAALRRLATFSGSLTCDWPNRDLLRYDGTLTVARRRPRTGEETASGHAEDTQTRGAAAGESDKETRAVKTEEMQVPVNIHNMLLRGCRLRSTDWIIGLAVYTGEHTKIQLNSGPPRAKRSRVEMLTGRAILGIALLQLITCSATALASTFLWYSPSSPWKRVSYLHNPEDQKLSPVVYWITQVLTCVVLTANLIPISLILQTTMVKAIQASMINSTRVGALDPGPVGLSPARRSLAERPARSAQARRASLRPGKPPGGGDGGKREEKAEARQTAAAQKDGGEKGDQGGGKEEATAKREGAREPGETGKVASARFSLPFWIGASSVLKNAKPKKAKQDRATFVNAFSSLADAEREEKLAGALPTQRSQEGTAVSSHALGPSPSGGKSRGAAASNGRATEESEIACTGAERDTQENHAQPGKPPRQFRVNLRGRRTEGIGGRGAAAGEESSVQKNAGEAEQARERSGETLGLGEEVSEFDAEEEEAKAEEIVARTSDLNEELGQVSYVFADKTGTLTENVMEFRKCCIQGIRYGDEVDDERLRQAAAGWLSGGRDNAPLPPERRAPHVHVADPTLRAALSDPHHPMHCHIVDFFLHLAVNHSALAEHDEETGHLCWSRPLWASLARGFLERAFRPCLVCSVLLTKGADMVILPRLRQSEKPRSQEEESRKEEGREHTDLGFAVATPAQKETAKGEKQEDIDEEREARRRAMERALEAYAGEGLRTLCVAKRTIGQEEFSSWYEEYLKLQTSRTKDKEERLYQLADRLEYDLELQGVTGVEDRLQEDVAVTIEKLRQAGIHVWMLSGDKTETALNVGLATFLVSRDMRLSRYLWNGRERNEEALEDQLRADLRALDASLTERPSAGFAYWSRRQARSLSRRLGSEVRRSPDSGLNEGDAASGGVPAPPDAVIVDGEALKFLFATSERQLAFIRLCCACRSVICCRLAPHQKGAVVDLVKTTTQKVTLAIGDGSNDCNMILQAQIGVGIRGNEGSQAFNCSDFGVTQFRLLLPLLLVHGRWCYRRVTTVILYIIYKNFLLVLPLVYFGFLCLFSGQRFYPETLAQTYNPVLTALPITLYGVLEQDVDKHASLKFPQLYRLGQKDFLLNLRTCFSWIFLGAVHAGIIFVVALYSFGYYIIPGTNGKPFDMWMVGTVMMMANCLVANLAILFYSFSVSSASWLGVSFSLFSCLVLFFASSTATAADISTGAIFLLFESFPAVFLYALVVCSLALGLLWCGRTFRLAFRPELFDVIQRHEYLGLPILSAAERRHLRLLQEATESKKQATAGRGAQADGDEPPSPDEGSENIPDARKKTHAEKSEEPARGRLRCLWRSFGRGSRMNLQIFPRFLVSVASKNPAKH